MIRILIQRFSVLSFGLHKILILEIFIISFKPQALHFAPGFPERVYKFDLFWRLFCSGFYNGIFFFQLAEQTINRLRGKLIAASDKMRIGVGGRACSGMTGTSRDRDERNSGDNLHGNVCMAYAVQGKMLNSCRLQNFYVPFIKRSRVDILAVLLGEDLVCRPEIVSIGFLSHLPPDSVLF